MDFPRVPPQGYELQSRNTDYWVERAQFEHWRALGVEEKVELIEAWNAAVDEFQEAALMRENPGASSATLRRLAAEARYGRPLVERFLALRDRRLPAGDGRSGLS